MRVTAGDWRRNVVERIGDMVRKCAILHIDGAVIGIFKFLGKLGGGNRVIGRAAVRPEHGQILWRNANPVSHRKQSGFELLGFRYRG